jgi:hypothetical protein
MPISRRIFIKTASVAAIVAATLGKSTLVSLAQEAFQPGANDPLANYTQATFTQYINSIFRLHAFTTVDVTLTKVEDTLPTTVSREGGRESFLLHFRGGSVKLPQDTYVVEHAALGTFKLFLVPNGADQNGAQGYVATINRLAYKTKISAPKAMPRKAVPSSSEPKAEPLRSPTVAPDSKTPSPAEKPKPQVKPRRRKFDPDTFPELDY